MNTANARSFAIEILPKEWPDEASMVNTAMLLRHLRLYSLQSSPDAFASTYEKEIEMSPEMWIERLQTPVARHVIATAKTDPKDEIAEDRQVDETMNAAGWVGMLVLVEKNIDGRQPANLSPWINVSQKLDDRNPPADLGDIKVEEHTMFYQVNGMFVHPYARRCGVGKLLIQRALRHVKERILELGMPACRVDVLVEVWNAPATGLYHCCGFVGVGEDKFVVNGLERKALCLSQMIQAR